MNTVATRVQDIAPLSRLEAMTVAAAELDRFLDLLRSLAPEEWRRPTECEPWDVRTMATHVLGATESHSSIRETVHQMRTYRAAKSGPMIDAMTALQVRDRADLAPGEVVVLGQDQVVEVLLAPLPVDQTTTSRGARGGRMDGDRHLLPWLEGQFVGQFQSAVFVDCFDLDPLHVDPPLG